MDAVGKIINFCMDRTRNTFGDEDKNIKIGRPVNGCLASTKGEWNPDSRIGTKENLNLGSNKQGDSYHGEDDFWRAEEWRKNHLLVPNKRKTNEPEHSNRTGHFRGAGNEEIKTSDPVLVSVLPVSSGSSNPSSPKKPETSYSDKLKVAAYRAFGSGAAGAAAGVVQVSTLMWLRTLMNYQQKHGNNGLMVDAKKLYAEGGISRFYRGLPFALIQGPMSKFGDTAANTGMHELFNSNESSKNLPTGVKTAAGSLVAASMRAFLMPIDYFKTYAQVNNGFKPAVENIRKNGIRVVYNGTVATCGAHAAGNFPWFFVHDQLDASIPKDDSNFMYKLSRRAGIGFSASAVSDTVTNGIRVLKVYKQTHASPISYSMALKEVLEKDGASFLVRGLKPKLLGNGLQGAIFSVVWKYCEPIFTKKD
ncbi:hypothetical protein HOH45_01005 [bacterium]|jgi:hypothetical protein|nr:hypothetical protein [bacterium]